MPRILVIDDEAGVRESLGMILESKGYSVDSSPSALEGLELIDSGKSYDFIISDIRMPGLSGLDFLKELRGRDVGSIVIMISAYGSVETSVEAIKNGADDYINKPIVTEELILRMKMAEEKKRLRRENVYLRKELGSTDEFSDIITESENMLEVIYLAEKASQFKTTVLIVGESGTGKELIAKAIHRGSNRSQKPFVAVNCAAIPETLLESELFGYMKGAFSGADTTKRGLFEEADNGTIFLDEIGEFPLLLQPKLLRVLQEQEIRRLGDTKTINIDVRVVTATSRDLEQEVEEGRFRSDLYYRLNVFPISMPPLRERLDDIPALVTHFIEKNNDQFGKKITGVAPEALEQLMKYPWHGNIRELENVVERAMIVSDTPEITDFDLGDGGVKSKMDLDNWLVTHSFDEAKKELEQLYIQNALKQTGGNRTKAAKLLGISRRSLLYKIKDLEDS